MTVSGSQVEYANDDFVRGQPQRLGKICDPFVARVKQDIELRFKQDTGEHPILDFELVGFLSMVLMSVLFFVF